MKDSCCTGTDIDIDIDQPTMVHVLENDVDGPGGWHALNTFRGGPDDLDRANAEFAEVYADNFAITAGARAEALTYAEGIRRRLARGTDKPRTRAITCEDVDG